MWSAGPLVVFVNGERLPLMEDRRFHVAAFFPEGATLADPVFDPPRPILMSKLDGERGVTAFKLQPYGRYIAAPPRTARFGVVLHGLPLNTSQKSIARALSRIVAGSFEEAIIMNSPVTETPCNSRAIVFMVDPSHGEMLISIRELQWDTMGTIVIAEPYEVLPVSAPHLFATAIKGRGKTEAAVSRLVTASANLGPNPVARYYVKFVGTAANEAQWSSEGVFADTVEFSRLITASLSRGPVVIIFALDNDVVGFGSLKGTSVSASGDTAECRVEWQAKGVRVPGEEIDTGAVIFDLKSMQDHDLIRVDLASEACATVSRKLAILKAQQQQQQGVAPALSSRGRGRGGSHIDVGMWDTDRYGRGRGIGRGRGVAI